MPRARKSPSRPKRGKNTFVTHSGNTIKINRTLGDKLRARSDNLARLRAERLVKLPKSRFKRFLSKLKPSYQIAYWTSGEGALMSLKILGVGIVVLFILLVGLFAYFRKDLPQLNNISGQNLGGSITYYDRTGTVVLWQDYDAIKRIPVPSNQISQYVKDATVAIEDKNFYHEGAFSVTGTIRAALHDLIKGGGGGLQGGSTITQQLVKLNEGWTTDATITRKAKELILAVDISREYTKNDVLTGYLNIAPYGGVDYGVQAAAEDYFNENASQLTLAQSAMLAAIPQAPSYYSPYSSPVYNPSVTVNEFGEAALTARADYILGLMAKQGYITNAQATAAKAVNVLGEVHQEQTLYSGIQDPYFVLTAKQQLEDKYGASTVNHGGWKVITTLNVPLQNLANALVAKNLPLVERNHGDEEAIVAESTQTGQVDALVGGVDFNNPNYGQINYAETLIPPGSSFKPYDYSTLINNTDNVGAGSMLYDVGEPLPGYPCTTGSLQPLQGGNCLEDYDFRFPGPEEIRYALAGSRNVPAVKAMLSVIPNKQCEENIVAGCVPSINKVISTADAMMDVPNGYQCYSDVALTQPTQCYASSAFGDGAYLTLANHTNGLATIARGGSAIPQTLILKITDSSGNVIYNWTQPKPVQVLKPDTAFIIDNILDDPRASYLPTVDKFQSYNGWEIAVKTGTTNNEYDALMTAQTTQYTVASWVGYHTRNVALTAGLSEAVTEPLTKGWIEGALSMLNEKAINWVQPADIKVLPSFIQSTHIDYGDEEPGPSTDVYPSWYSGPALTGAKSKAQTIDKISNMVATSCTPPLATESTQSQNQGEFSIDLFYPIGTTLNLGTSTSTATDDVHSCSDPAIPSPTVTVSDSVSGLSDTTTNPGDTTCATSCNIVVALGAPTPPDNTGGAAPYARYPITVNLLVNGQVSATQTIQSSSVYPGDNIQFTYTTTSATAATISVQLIDNALYSVTASPTPAQVVVTAGT
jgi:membrane peptidoglycan carboxypeptidase